MGIWRSARELLKRNPALELLLGVGICSAVVGSAWNFAGMYPEPKLSDSQSKALERLKLKTNEENYLLLQENEKLKMENYLLMQENVKHRNQESYASSSRKP